MTKSARDFIATHCHRDALRPHQHRDVELTAVQAEEVAWELGYEREPYAGLIRFEGLAAALGADLLGAHQRGYAARGE